MRQAEACSTDAMRHQFIQLTEFLKSTRYLWQPRPFMQLPCPWEDAEPQISQWLRGLDEAMVDALETDPGAMGASSPAAFRERHENGLRLVEIPALVDADFSHPDGTGQSYGIPDRKWRQIRSFSACINSYLTETPPNKIVDWCAGKGHLGRTLAHAHQCRAALVERNGVLRQDAEKYASYLGVIIEFRCADVLSSQVADVLKDADVAVGLHACGILGQRLLEQSAAMGTPFAALATCCYHNLGGQSRYVPASSEGAAQDFPLDASLLRLTTADEVVARPSVRKARRREMAWRLGLDVLLREALGRDEYLPLGPIARAVLDLPFEAFARVVAEQRGLPLPAVWEPNSAERVGWERCRVVRALGLMRCLFRRPLELWVVLDRALRLVEMGRRVNVGTFCRPSVSPRNIIIISRT